MTGTISRDELKRKMERKDDFLLLETLAPAAYEQGHLPGAVNVPLDKLREMAPDLAPEKDAEIVVYCASPT
ncbi:MAG TPA: rhodanese-like domain-containing protein [Candidatus Acidoferrales bacterium]|nr:rhodanese-like domain-containing protein [Candidatus Acidoferrales bacterium]